MPYCPKCGNEVVEQNRYCPKCGAKISIAFERPVENIKEPERIFVYKPQEGNSVERKAQSLNWFQRHLNWTVVLTAIGTTAVVFGLSIFFAVTVPNAPDELYFPLFIIPLVVIMPVAGWALKRKNRSLWWLLILFIPFGWIVYLCLENRRYLLERGDELRSSYLAYYEELTKLMVFQTNEADLYNNVLVKHGYSTAYDMHAMRELVKASRRLANSALELNRRVAHLPSLPDEINRVRFSWQKAFDDYSAWAQAQAASTDALADGRRPMTKRVREYY